MLRQVADYMEKEIVTQKGIKGALMYPAIALCVTAVVVGVLMFFVLPAFAGFYADLGAKLPAMTSMMLSARGYPEKIFPAYLAGIFIVVGVGYDIFQNPGRQI